jgi:hypothetical protein
MKHIARFLQAQGYGIHKNIDDIVSGLVKTKRSPKFEDVKKYLEQKNISFDDQFLKAYLKENFGLT